MKKLALLLAAVLAAAPLASCSSDDDSETISIPILDTQEISYSTAQAEVGTISKIYKSTASMDYPYKTVISFDQDGTIADVLVDDGATVKKGDVLCKLETDDIDKQLDDEKLRLDAAKKTYDTLVNEGIGGNELEFAKIDYDIETIAYKKLKETRSRYTIKAPADGTIALAANGRQDFAQPLSSGSRVSSGTKFATMVDQSEQKLCAFIYDNQLENVNFGSKVTLTQGKLINTTGKVTDILYFDGGTDYSGWTYVIEPDDKDVEFVDFGSVDVTFNVYEKQNVVTVPAAAIKTVSDRKFVYLLVNGVKVEADVETGIENEDNVEITGGLSGGEQVILR
ncbi:MAG: efflux RND transporter periplasmic adaptor subunit [Oscillospiraceae bacterium]